MIPVARVRAPWWRRWLARLFARPAISLCAVCGHRMEPLHDCVLRMIRPENRASAEDIASLERFAAEMRGPQAPAASRGTRRG